MGRRTIVRLSGAFALVLLAFAAAGCGGSPSSPSSYAPFSQIDLVFGQGASAETGKILTLNYNGWLYDSTAADFKGVQFASSLTSGQIFYTAGDGTVIQGWERGVLGMKEGGIRRLVIPPSLGYGPNRYTIIPPNATLVFELELVKVE